MLDTAPKKNIRLLPRKKAMTVTMQPTLAFLAKRVKFGVAVPPETKLPTTRPAPARTPSVLLPWANCSTNEASPFLMARIMAVVPRMATAGTAT